jgi:phosphodiester glycosidase
MRTTRVWRNRGVAALAAAGLLVGLGMQGAQAAGRTVTKKTLAPGVVFETITDTSYPAREYVLLYDGTVASAAIDQVLSAPQIGTFQKTSVMSANAGAIAGVNGDLNDWPARPTHQYVSNGMPIQTSTPPGVSLGFRQDKRGATINRSGLKISATDVAAKTTFPVASWNEALPTTDQVVGYSWYGGRYDKPQANQCSARLSSPGQVRWNTGKDGTGRDYTVDAVKCSTSTAMTVTSASTVVLSSKLVGKGATWIKSLKVGSTVHVGWADGTPGAVDVVSGSADILQNGVIQYAANCNDDLCLKNPRTAVGITATGGIIIMVVDGRSSGSNGLTLYQLGKEMKALGAVNAVNLDGGGSATMWIKGIGVVNHPTDSSGERPVSNAIVILPRANPAEPVPAPAR